MHPIRARESAARRWEGVSVPAALTLTLSQGERGPNNHDTLLDVQIARLERVFFDEFAAGLDLVAHENAE
jgi:hypothetical protein